MAWDLLLQAQFKQEVYTLRVERTQRLIKTKELLCMRSARDPIINAPNVGGICLDLRSYDKAIVKGDVLTMVKP